MRALFLEKPGPPAQLKIKEVADPVPDSYQVRVRVKAVGLNPVDYKLAQRGWPSWKWPHILGLDVAGEVDRVGDKVTLWRPHDRVFYHGDLSKWGGFAELSVAPSHILAAIPGGVSYEDAAAIPCAGYTAWQILSRKVPTKPGQTALIHGGAGGVGGFAVQLAHFLGLRVIATCSSTNMTYVKKLGADHVIDYQHDEMDAQLRQWSGGRGADLIINTIDAASATDDLDRLAFGGHLACVAGLPDFNRITPFTRAPSIHEIALGAAHLSGDLSAQRDLAEMGKELIAMVENGRLTTMITRVVSMEDIPQALVRLSFGHTRGKVVARIGDTSHHWHEEPRQHPPGEETQLE